MSNVIQILPPQLANQIAAGEVVERPASVVKELVENSLDAGANQISIEIEKGGSQLIKIRDNGCGISKADLPLALARHATSKISSLEDLEAILSLGFRGEALASISSVSRLTLTSRTADQTEAWQAYAQGREMTVEIQPASHPVGTTIEVANLFFNTPARRKFLRTDKTEFAHIDEVVRRIALAKPNISFSLTHNGKIVRQYRKVADHSVAQQQKRVAAICGDEFIQHATHLDWQHGDLHLHGWIGDASLARPQNDFCYSYVNGRMMRDKTINHAIRQAYGERLAQGDYPAFVLFLDLDPTMVDVNVHPAKHEVRFHQSRLVHDFILQGVSNVLQTEHALNLRSEINEPLPNYQGDNNRLAAGANVFATPVFQPSTPPQAVRFSDHFTHSPKNSGGSKSSQKWYGELLKTDESKPFQQVAVHSEKQDVLPHSVPVNLSDSKAELAHSQTLAIVKNQALLLKERDEFYLLSLDKLARLRFQLQLQNAERQALLIPLSINLDENQAERWQLLKTPLAALGFEIVEKAWQGSLRLSINQVPKLLREQNLQQILLTLLNQQAADCLDFFANYAEIPTAYSLSESVTWLAEVENHQQSKPLLDKLKLHIHFDELLKQC